MNSTTVYDMFDPDRIGWLKYRHEKKLEIRKDDIIRLMQVDPMNACDPLMQSYLLLALKGKLNGAVSRTATSLR